MVIAIIAILAAMLMPALQQARGRAHTANCISNLKQMGTAATFYTDAHDGFYHGINTLLGKSGAKVEWQKYFIENMGISYKMLTCPTIRNWTDEYHVKESGNCYGVNSQSLCGTFTAASPGSPDGWTTIKTSQIGLPSKTVYTGDTRIANASYPTDPSAWESKRNMSTAGNPANGCSKLIPVHGGICNVLWTDGSVMSMRSIMRNYVSGNYCFPFACYDLGQVGNYNGVLSGNTYFSTMSKTRAPLGSFNF